jgi:hypothetical protein
LLLWFHCQCPLTVRILVDQGSLQESPCMQSSKMQYLAEGMQCQQSVSTDFLTLELDESCIASQTAILQCLPTNWTKQDSPLKGGESSPVLGPQGLEMHREADRATPVHLGGLSLQFRDPDLRGCGGVCRRDVKIEVEFESLQVVHVPAFATPFRALLVAGNSEPIRIRGFVQLYVPVSQSANH